MADDSLPGPLGSPRHVRTGTPAPVRRCPFPGTGGPVAATVDVGRGRSRHAADVRPSDAVLSPGRPKPKVHERTRGTPDRAGTERTARTAGPQDAPRGCPDRAGVGVLLRQAALTAVDRLTPSYPSGQGRRVWLVRTRPYRLARPGRVARWTVARRHLQRPRCPRGPALRRSTKSAHRRHGPRYTRKVVAGTPFTRGARRR